MSFNSFDQLKKRIGKNIKYYDDTIGWKTGRDVTETDVGDFVNEIYIEQLFPLYASRYPHMFRETAYTNSWITTFVVDPSSSTTTLVSTTSVFTNGMVGLYLYNNSTTSVATIIAYNSPTSVTLDQSVSWSGVTVSILGKEFSFGQDASDIYTIESVSVLYHPIASGAVSTSPDPATKYVKAQLRELEDLIQYGNEIGSEFLPFSYLTTINTTTGLQAGVGLFPKFKDLVTNGLFINYITKPPLLSASGDVPNLPSFSALLAGGTMRAFEKMQQYQQSGYWMQKYELYKKQEMSRFRPQTSDRPVQININRNSYYIHKRII